MSQEAIISKVFIIVSFYHIKAEVAKFDLAVNICQDQHKVIHNGNFSVVAWLFP